MDFINVKKVLHGYHWGIPVPVNGHGLVTPTIVFVKSDEHCLALGNLYNDNLKLLRLISRLDRPPRGDAKDLTDSN